MTCQNRNSVLRKFGLTEDDVRHSEILFRQMPPPPPPDSHIAQCLKEETILGYTTLRLKREKALRVLGASEEDVNIENSKNLGSLGLAGRKRSFVIQDISTKRKVSHLSFCNPRKMSLPNTMKPHRKKSHRRRSTGDARSLKRTFRKVVKLKHQNEEANAEIERLRQRIGKLENALGLKGENSDSGDEGEKR